MASGIVLPQAAKEKPQTGRVVAISDSEDGRISEGDLVVFAKYSGTKIALDNEDYLILDSDDLLGIVEEQRSAEEGSQESVKAVICVRL